MWAALWIGFGWAFAEEAAARPARNVAIVVYDGVEVLDFAGPAEVFAVAADQAAFLGEPVFRVYTVAASREPRLSQKFLTVVPEYGIDDAPPPDILVIPGGSSRALTDDEAFMAWAGPAMEQADLTLTVCTGAFVPARLGRLDGLVVTTHHSSLDRLREVAPAADVQADRRFVDNGHVVTTAGVSAGIDGALHVVARLHGRSVAEHTARYMEYAWSPEPGVAYELLDPSLEDRGRAIQQAHLHAEAGDLASAAAGLRALVKQDAKDAQAWLLLADVLRGDGQAKEALDAARRAAAFDETRADALFVQACALASLGKGDDALANLGKAVEAGFTARWRIEWEPAFEPLRTDPRYEAVLARL